MNKKLAKIRVIFPNFKTVRVAKIQNTRASVWRENIQQLLAEGEVDSPMFTEPEVNNYFSIIFRGEYQGPQNSGLQHKNRDAIVRLHTRMQP